MKEWHLVGSIKFRSKDKERRKTGGEEREERRRGEEMMAPAVSWHIKLRKHLPVASNGAANEYPP